MELEKLKKENQELKELLKRILDYLLEILEE